jgi:hypothetical protein
VFAVGGACFPPQGRQQDQQGFVSLEDPSLLETSPAMLVMGQQISLVQVGW